MSQVRQVNRVVFQVFWTYVLEPTRSWHAWECSEHISTRADPRVQEPTRPEWPQVWQAARADSNTSESTRSEEFKCAQKGEPTLIARSRSDASTEPTRTTHTDRITASFFSLLLIQNLKRLDLKSQRSESWKSSLKAHEAPLKKEKKRTKRKKRREGIVLQ